MVVSFSLYAVYYYSDNYNFENNFQPKNNGILQGDVAKNIMQWRYTIFKIHV